MEALCSGSSRSIRQPAGKTREKAAQPEKAKEILSGKKNTSGDNVVVIGGGSVGVETAAHLAQDFKQVTILEVRDKISMDGEFSNNYFLFKLL